MRAEIFGSTFARGPARVRHVPCEVQAFIHGGQEVRISQGTVVATRYGSTLYIGIA